MTIETLIALFEKYGEENIDRTTIGAEYRRTSRQDLDAFLLLDGLVPAEPIEGMHGYRRDMLGGAEHDKIWLDITPEQLAAVCTEEHIRVLSAFGVNYDSEFESLYMFV